MLDLRCGDSLELLSTLPTSSVDACISDPPYFRVKSDAWDNQWDSDTDYLAWLDTILAEVQRVLRPNGSLYLFASPQMAARVECLMATRFDVLNHIVWRKQSKGGGAIHKRMSKEALRHFFPQTERILFAQHHGADNRAKGEPGYAAKCDEVRGFVFEPLRAYLDGERRRSGLTSEQLRQGMYERTGKRYVLERHAFGRSQWELPTREQYEAFRAVLNSQGGDHLKQEYACLTRQYDDLKAEYETLKREYESLRRPFNVSADVPYTDVWDFETVPPRAGKHPCEKPLPLMRHIVATSTRPGAVVLDMFMGSGSTLVAAREAGCGVIGFERDESIYRSAVERITNDV